MAFVAVDYSGTPQVESRISQKMLPDVNVNNFMPGESQASHEEHSAAEGSLFQEKITGTETLDKGYLEYGCSHYRRRCQIRAPCCSEIFDCRHCHNEAKNNICIDQELRHDIPRHLIEKVICSSVTPNRRFNKFAQSVVHPWEDIIVKFASSLMMIYLRSSIIVMAVAFAGLEAPRISSTVTNVNAAILCF